MLGFSSIFASGFSSSVQSGEADSSSKISWLFSVDAKIDGSAGQIHMHDVTRVIQFSDRPHRLAKAITADALSSIVIDMARVEKDPPNAVVVGTDAAGKPFNAVVELTGSRGSMVKDGAIEFDIINVGQMDDAAAQMTAITSCKDCTVAIFIDSFGSGSGQYGNGCSDSIWHGVWCKEGLCCQHNNYMGPCYYSQTGWVADKGGGRNNAGWCKHTCNNDFDHTSNEDYFDRKDAGTQDQWARDYREKNCPNWNGVYS